MGMDPNTGDYVSSTEWDNLSPAERERYTVRLRGTAEDIEKMSAAIKELRALRREAKVLARSGHPAKRADGRKTVAEIDRMLR